MGAAHVACVIVVRSACCGYIGDLCFPQGHSIVSVTWLLFRLSTRASIVSASEPSKENHGRVQCRVLCRGCVSRGHIHTAPSTVGEANSTFQFVRTTQRGGWRSGGSCCVEGRANNLFPRVKTQLKSRSLDGWCSCCVCVRLHQSVRHPNPCAREVTKDVVGA